jgi:putative endopeptidase
MKKSLALAASLLAMAVAAPATAAPGHDHACIDDACSMVSIFDIDDDQAGGGGAAMVDAQRMGAWGIDLAGMDRSVKPGDDFFGYVNGNWAKNTPIPSDRSSYGAFAILRDLSEARLKQLVESYPAGDPATGGDQAKISALYTGFMDEAAIERTDAVPLLTRVAPIFMAKSREDMAVLMGRSIGGFGSTFFGPGISDDAKNPERYALYMGQSGLGLGDRELYLDAKFKPQKDRYTAYVAQMLEMAGWPTPRESAAKVVAMETQIAQAHWTRAESRNRDKTYNPLSLAELQAQAPGFPWATYFPAAGVERSDRVVVSQVTAVPKLAQIFAETDLQTLKAWQMFHTADDMSPLLSKRFADASSSSARSSCRASRSSASAGSAALRWPRTRSARRSAATMSRFTSSPTPRPRWTAWSPIFAPR